MGLIQVQKRSILLLTTPTPHILMRHGEHLRNRDGLPTGIYLRRVLCIVFLHSYRNTIDNIRHVYIPLWTSRHLATCLLLQKVYDKLH